MATTNAGRGSYAVSMEASEAKYGDSSSATSPPPALGKLVVDDVGAYLADLVAVAAHDQGRESRREGLEEGLLRF